MAHPRAPRPSALPWSSLPFHGTQLTNRPTFPFQRFYRSSDMKSSDVLLDKATTKSVAESGNGRSCEQACSDHTETSPRRQAKPYRTLGRDACSLCALDELRYWRTGAQQANKRPRGEQDRRVPHILGGAPTTPTQCRLPRPQTNLSYCRTPSGSR